MLNISVNTKDYNKSAKSIFVLFLLLASSFVILSGNMYTPHNSPDSTYFIPDSVAGVVPGNAGSNSISSHAQLSIVISFPFSNQGQLNTFLSQMQDPQSPLYHHYLTASEFNQRFSPSASAYNAYVSYFTRVGFNVKTYSDRVSMVLSGSASQFETTFHTTISQLMTKSGRQYYAPTSQLSLSVSYGKISSIVGMNSRVVPKISPLYEGAGTYQVFYGGDFQSLYQLNRLYEEYGYPTNVTIATILWSGTNSSGVSVAPFVPANINHYFQNNLPPGEPIPKVYGYPLNGAPAPGPSAANDTGGVNVESTMDLEMAGSAAPGANIVEVYGPNATLSNLDQAFAAILNPSYNTTVNNALSHVVAISNSWGTTDTNDSTWMQYEEEASARGITVLASSGDNGNSNGAVAPSFPASMAYNNFGTLAVGGATGIINGTPSLDGIGTTDFSSQSVWYNTPGSGDGSQGGVSANFNEPSWQSSSTDANGVITGSSSITGLASGRGTPDISADGSNMAIYISSGTSTGYIEVWGTSVASPLLAGTIAVMDHSLGSNEGFMNPLIYNYGQSEYSGTMSRAPPIYNVANGSNGAFSAQDGYSLAVGWGTINAYNFVQAQKHSNVVTFEESGLPAGTNWYLNITGIGSSGPIEFGTYSLALPNGTYDFTASTAYGSYEATGLASSFSLSGSATVVVNFTESKYQVTFNENGLPDGYQWYVKILNGPTSGPISGNSYTTSLANGTYQYSVTSLNGGYFSLGGKVTVNGAIATVSIRFLQSAIANTGYVNSTLFILNNTVVAGNNPNAVSGFLPDCMLYDADNNYVYVGFSGSESISVLNTSNGQVVQTIPMNMYPLSITYDKASNTLYASNGESITVINGNDNKITGSIPETGGIGRIMYLPYNGYLYVTNPGWNSVSVYNPATGNLVKRIGVGTSPLPMVFDPMNDCIYVANEASANVSVIDAASNSVVATISIGYYPSGGITVNSAGTQIYLTADQAAGGYDSSYVCAINASSNTMLYTNNIGSSLFYPTEYSFSDSMVYDSSTGMVLATGGLTGKLYELSPQSNCSIIASTGAGSYPNGMAIDPENGYIYIANSQGDATLVINGQTMATVASVLLGTTPSGIYYNPENRLMYILGYETASFSGIGVMNASTGRV